MSTVPGYLNTVTSKFQAPEKRYIIQSHIGKLAPRPVQEFGYNHVAFPVARRQLEMLMAWHEKHGDTVRDTGAAHPLAFVAERDGKFIASYAIVEVN